MWEEGAPFSVLREYLRITCPLPMRPMPLEYLLTRPSISNKISHKFSVFLIYFRCINFQNLLLDQTRFEEETQICQRKSPVSGCKCHEYWGIIWPQGSNAMKKSPMLCQKLRNSYRLYAVSKSQHDT